MAIFSVDKVMSGLVASLGLSPDEIRRFVNEIWTEFRTQKAEREAFKAACRTTVPDIVARLERIEAMQGRLIALLEPPARKDLSHERNQFNGAGHG